MSKTSAVNDLLLNKGWEYKSSCMCGGAHTVKYELQTKDGAYRLRVRHGNFSFAKPGGKLLKYPIAGLIKLVDEIHGKHKEDI